MFAKIIEWTPHLAGGFATNIGISALAMALGTLIGLGLGRMRRASLLFARPTASGLTSAARNIPSFVLMFYVAYLLPVEVTWNDTVIGVPTWLKATLALTFPAVGFASDQYQGYVRQRDAGSTAASRIFWTAWTQYFLIVLMASATASVIGADEVVGRANRLIATDNRPGFMIAVYVYISLWFLLSGMIISRYGPRLADSLTARRAERIPS